MEEVSFVHALRTKFCEQETESSQYCEIFIPKGAPGASGGFMVPSELALDGCGISTAGKPEEIADLCGDVRLLDLSNNNLSRWTEVFSILQQLHLVISVNISNNPLHLDRDSQLLQLKMEFPSVTKLALNNTKISWACISHILHFFPHLEELYLCLNQHKSVDITGVFPQVKRLHFNNNKICDWCHVCSLTRAFPNLESFVLMENPICHIGIDEELVSSTLHLQYVNLGQCLFNSWEEIDKLRNFPVLSEVRLQGNPLFQNIAEKERRQQLVARLPNITRLNGSKIHDTEREDAERAFIRQFMDDDDKPHRFYELEEKYGKLDPLAEVDLKVRHHVTVKIQFEGKVQEVVVNTKQQFSDFKKFLHKLISVPPSKMRIFYNDVGAPYGVEELRNFNRPLHNLNLRDGDEFIIDRK